MSAQALCHLLVPIDGSACSTAAIDYALRLTGPQGRISFVNVLDLGGLDAERRTLYAKAMAQARIAGVDAETIDLSGPVVEGIVNLSVRTNADGIVMGTHGRRGLKRAVLGSVANGVLRRVLVPTFVLNADGFVEAQPNEPIQRIVVDIDGSGALTPQIELAFDLAALHLARVFLVHVAGESDEATVDQDSEALRYGAYRGIRCEVVRGLGNAPNALLNAASVVGADLIVIGSVNPADGLFLRASICEMIVRVSPIPVAVAAHALAVAGSVPVGLR